MYKILVVDDEPRVSMGIKKVLLESDLQIGYVETAGNGFEAIDYLRMETFDLLLTDIQMSRMNGLELMETVYLEQPHLPVIVISAHEKFDFAKKSIQLGARDYLVKPVELEEMLRVVRQVLQEKDDAGSRSLEMSRQAAETPRRERRGEWLLELMTEQHISGREYEELTTELGRLLEGQPFGIVSIRLNLSHAGFSSRGITLHDRKLLKYGALNIVEESLYEWQGLTLSGLGNTLISLIRLSDQTLSGQRLDAQSQLHLIGQKIVMNIKQYLNIDAIVGISTLHRDLLMLPKLLEEAGAAVEWWRLHPGQKVFYYEDVLERENSGISTWIVKMDAFMDALKTSIGTGAAADPEPVLEGLKELLSAEEAFNSCFGMFVYRLYGLLLENGLDGGLSLQRFDPSVYFRSRDGLSRLTKLREYIREASAMALMLAKERDQTILSRITGYIRLHFRNPALKIQDIAGEVHFSTAYLSALFKRETGTNVWDYVTEQRIEEARRLLANTDKKRYEIAYEVGYESPEHFSRMFKRYTGLSPADFRKEDRRGDGLRLKYKVTLAFLLFIVGPFMIVGWISAFTASNAMKDEVGRTTLQLVRQNHLTLEKTLSSVNDKTVTLLDNYFFSDNRQYAFWTGIQTLGQILEADAILERWSSDGTEYTLYMRNRSGMQPPMDLSYKTRGFKYIDDSGEGLPDWATAVIDEGGGGTLRVVGKDNGSETVSYMRSILNPEAYNDTLGLLVVSRLEVLLTRDLVSVKLQDNATISLYNDRNEQLMHTGPADSPAVDPALLPGGQEGYYFASEGGTEWLYAYSRSNLFRTSLVYRIPVETMKDSQANFQVTMMVLSAIYLALVLFFVLVLLRVVVKPLSQLVAITKIYEPGKKLDLGDETPRTDELGILYGAFLKMMRRLDSSFEENYLMQIKQKENELTTLHSQITPHLLYNTLDSIYWYALESGNTDVGEMVKDLSKLLRIGLSKGKTIITVAEEIEHVQAYSRLQAKRYPDTFEAYWDIDAAALACETPKVLLQPLVENAIFHGVSSMDGEGCIWVRVALDGDDVCMTVEDNGFLPVDLDRLEAILSGADGERGYGIRNVHQRIQLHYGDAYGLRYSRREGGGLTASLRIPARNAGEQGE